MTPLIAGRVAADDGVDPAAAARAPGGRAELGAGLAQELAVGVEQLGRERPLADPGRVGLEDRDDAVDPGRRDAGAGAGTARGRVGRRDERVGAVVDVEQGGLAGLEQHGLALVEGLLEHQGGVGDHRTQPLGVPEQLVHHLVDLDGATVVDLGEDLVLVGQRGLDLLAQDLLVEQVLHPDADARHLVGVGRADAAAGRADLARAQEPLGHLVEDAVVRRDEVGVGADQQPRGVDAARLEAVELLEEDGQVDDDTVADDRGAGRGEDARRAAGAARTSRACRLSMTMVWPALLPPLNFTT